MSSSVCIIAWLAAFSLVGCATQPATLPVRSEARELIDALAARVPPEHEDQFHDIGISTSWAPVTKWDRDAERVGAAWQRLEAMGLAAFPALIASVGDKRFSFSTVGAAWTNHSVGDACFRIMESEVDFYGCGYKDRRGKSKPSYLWKMRSGIGLAAWWEARKHRNLRELQIKSLRWTIGQEEATGFDDDAERRQILQPLQQRLAVLTDAATQAQTKPWISQ